jgi:hypothetical protein
MDVSGELHARASVHREKIPSTHEIGCWLGPGAGLDTVEKIKRFSLSRILTPAVQPIAFRYTE